MDFKTTIVFNLPTTYTDVGLFVLNRLVDVPPFKQLNVSLLLPQLYAFFFASPAQLFRVNAFVFIPHTVRVRHYCWTAAAPVGGRQTINRITQNGRPTSNAPDNNTTEDGALHLRLSAEFY